MPKIIYILDDDPVILSLLEEFLSSLDLNIKLFSSWNQLKSELVKALPSILLLDLQMPEIDGLSVLKNIEELYPDNQIKIFLMSANEDTERLVKKNNVKVTEVIKKPFDVLELKNKLS